MAWSLFWALPARAASIDSRSQLHAVIGQPLAVILPVSLGDANPNGVAVKISPGPDLPGEEEAVAESVQAYYAAGQGAVRLSTASRVMVPAIALHVVVSSGNLVLNYDLDVLVDVPDLQAQHTARPVAPPPPTGEAQAPAIRVLAIDKPPAEVAPQRRYGNAPTTAADDAQRPSVTPPPPPPPPDPRPHSWTAQAGDTLGSIAHRLAGLYGVGDEPMALALYEANRDAFQQAPPQRAVAGRSLLVPEDYVMRSEPAARVADFRAWLRQPRQPWKLRAFPDPRPDAASPQPVPGQRSMLQAMVVVLGMTVAVAMAVVLLRRLRLRQLFTHYVPMSAVGVKKIRRIIIPAPPPRRGLSQGAVTEKLRIKRLREVLDDNPLRSDIRYRLAERLYKAGDARGFGQVAPPLRPSLSPQGWKRICAMGHELSPDDPRFLT